VAGAAGKTLTDFIVETLDARTQDSKADVEKIAEREKVSKKWV
jgi:hypothetical protein